MKPTDRMFFAAMIFMAPHLTSDTGMGFAFICIVGGAITWAIELKEGKT